ncbi:MocR-like transcriptional regulator GabR [Calidifontibacillus erzurumensis]|uniref:MocR-like transcriptional regulator GabR n=1 Tax=Calidifontibacillus erzurumensis TaxID=2741433 RepID=UPI0035B56F53
MIFLKKAQEMDKKYIYQHIYEEIKENILNGRLKPGEKLPPKRTLAEHLNVSINSVMNAYEQLLAEGYIYTVERKGYFVEKITQFINVGNTNKPLLADDLKESIHDKDGWLSLSHMNSNISLFPFKEWMKCQQKAIENHKSELSEIIHPQGPYIVRKTISRLIYLNRGVVCEPEQVVFGAGTMSLIQQLMGMQDKNSIVAMECPGYSRLYHLLKSMEFDVHPIHLDDKGINIQEIEKSNVNFVFVTPSHQFPTGKIMPISRRIELLNWATVSENRFIVEDDYDSEYKYETDNIPSLQSLDRNQRVIYLGTFSKTMLPGMRISYMVLPPDLLRKYRLHYSNFIQPCNTLNLFTLHYFIENGDYNRHLKRMNNHYETNRKILIKELNNRFGENIKIEDVPAGLHFLAHFKTDKSYEEIVNLANKEKLEVYTIKRFMYDKPYYQDGWVSLVIGFANIQANKIAEAIDRLHRILFKKEK